MNIAIALHFTNTTTNDALLDHSIGLCSKKLLVKYSHNGEIRHDC